MVAQRSAPIGVFDSGIGGLTVVSEMMRQLPHESIIYFGDTARVPYGPKSPDTVRRYSHEITSFLRAEGVLEAEKIGKEVYLRINKEMLEGTFSTVLGYVRDSV